MSQKTQLLIYNPCDEQWGNMQPDQEGRFCGSCRKTVVDFTMMTDQELLTWFAKDRTNVCGRTTEDQLGRDLAPVMALKKNRWVVWWQLLLAGVLMSSEASAQVRPPKAPVGQYGNNIVKRRLVMGKMTVLPPAQVVKIIDSATQQPLSGVSVQVDDDLKFFISDSTGQVVIPYYRMIRASTLKISSVGYAHVAITVDEEWLGTDKVVKLVVTPMEMTPAIVRGYATQTLAGRVGGLIAVRREKRSVYRVIKDTLLCRKPQLTIYPNPVARGASITLSLRIDKPGDYMAQLFSSGGTVVESLRMEGIDKAGTELMDIPMTLAAGVYFVRVFHLTTGEMYTEKIVVL